MSRHDISLVARAFRPDGDLATNEIPDGVMNPLVKDGILVRSKRRTLWSPGDDEDVFPIQGDAKRGFYVNPGYGRIELTLDDISLWRPDVHAVCERLHERFDCRDAIPEIVPGRLIRLGCSTMAIGRKSLRVVYFIPFLDNGSDPILDRIAEESDFIVLVGCADFCEFSGRIKDRLFTIEDALEIDDRGVWKIRGDLLNSRFASPVMPETKKTAKKIIEQTNDIAARLQEKCFEFRHDYNGHRSFQKEIKSLKGLATAMGVKYTTLHDWLGGDARSKNRFPTVFFWWDCLMEKNDLYNYFEEWVHDDVPRHLKKDPETLYKEIDHFMSMKAIRAAAKAGERRK